MAEHPKSAVLRILAQRKDINAKILIDHKISYTHRHVGVGNLDIFTGFLNFTYSDTKYEIVSKEYLAKKDVEKEIYGKILDIINNNSFDNVLNCSLVNNALRNNAKQNDNDINNARKSTINSSSELTNINSPILSSDTSYKKEKIIVSPQDDSSTPIDIYRSSKKNSPIGKNIQFVIVDLENVSKTNDIIQLTSYVNDYNQNNENYYLDVIKVAGFCSSVKNNADIIVRSSRKDAMDHYISYLVGSINAYASFESKNTHIYVITRDNFASCLQDFCKFTTHCSDVSDFFQIMQNV